MRVLVVKLSSMGDIIHSLPAINDAANAIANIKVTWLIEQGFQEIAYWHPSVEKVIPTSLRKRKIKPIINSLKQIRQQKYDLVIDAQGLLKSSILAKLARAKSIAGYDRSSCREPIASLLYDHKINVDKNLHAVDRLRQLFSKALNYSLSIEPVNYGINWTNIIQSQTGISPYLVFLHGTTWDTKHWPEEYWQQLACLVGKHGFKVYVTWSTAEQQQRAQRLAAYSNNVVILSHLSINQVATVLHNAQGVVAVDTGFAHLAAAMSKPIVALYGPTDAKKVGTIGERAINLSSKFACAPCSSRSCTYQGEKDTQPVCFKEISPRLVWEKLSILLNHSVNK